MLILNMHVSPRPTYLTAVGARAVDGGRNGNDLVGVDVSPAACAETSVEPSALEVGGRRLAHCVDRKVQAL